MSKLKKILLFSTALLIACLTPLTEEKQLKLVDDVTVINNSVASYNSLSVKLVQKVN